MKKDKDLNPELENESNDAPVSSEEQVASEEIKTEETPEDKFNEFNDRFLRLYAEFDNFRKRSNKEKIDLIVSANASLLKELLPIMDDFDRAILNNETATELESVKEGFNLIHNKFKSIVESKGVKVMEAKNQTFDSEFHEAIANIPVEEEAMKGKVIDDVEKGYLLNDKVLRFAKVVVGQ